MLKPLGKRLDLVAERKSGMGSGQGNSQGKGTFEVHGARFGVFESCVQLEEAPRKLQSTQERAGEMPSPLKEHTHNFGKVERNWRSLGRVRNPWGTGEKYPDSLLYPYSQLLFTSCS